MIWGEPEDKVVRGRSMAVTNLRQSNACAAEILARTGTIRIGVNGDYSVVVFYYGPNDTSGENSVDFPLADLTTTSEDTIANELARWAIDLADRGYQPYIDEENLTATQKC
jgi:hypothetical protein